MVGEGAQGETQAAARLRWPFAAACLLAFTLLLGGCGLGEYIIFYNAPSLSATGANTFEIRHNTENNTLSTFQGYVIYYRAYQLESGASADISAISSLTSSDNPDPELVLSRLKALQFQEISDSENPLLLQPSGVTATYLVTLLNTPADFEWTIKEELDAVPTVIKRGISTRASFNSEYRVEDLDFESTEPSPTHIWFVFYAFALGARSSTEFFSSVPSLPSDPAKIEYTPYYH